MMPIDWLARYIGRMRRPMVTGPSMKGWKMVTGGMIVMIMRTTARVFMSSWYSSQGFWSAVDSFDYFPSVMERVTSDKDMPGLFSHSSFQL